MSVGWGIIGCGDITENRGAPAIVAQPDSELVAFQSRTSGRAREFADRFGAPRAYEQREDLLADVDVTAVYIATEHYRHLEDTLAAAAAGKHVLVEKPMAMDVAECRDMIDACRTNGVFLSVAYYRRFYPKVRKMKELLQRGVIGEPVSVSIHLAGRLRTEGLHADNWRVNAEQSGGGSLVDAGSHRIDLLCDLLGEPDRVGAFVECREIPIEAPDMETLLIRMKSGAHVVSRHSFRTESDDEFEIVGTEGRLSATPMDGPALRLVRGDETEEWNLPRHANVHYPLMDNFARGLVNGEGPEFDGGDGLLASQIIQAAYDSARNGAIVAVTDGRDAAPS